MPNAAKEVIIPKEPNIFRTFLYVGQGDSTLLAAPDGASGLGFVAGANPGDSMAVFEPIHGSAPKHAGKNIANPVAAIIATKMMINYLGESEMAIKMEQAVKDILLEGKVRTHDLGGTSATTEIGEAIAKKLCQIG